MNLPRNARALAVVVCCALGAQILAAVPASAYPFRRSLQRGDVGRDVKALEIRVVGWYPSAEQASLNINQKYTRRTAVAVRAFQRFYGLAVDGVAGPATFSVLKELQDPNGSTVSFRWSEFTQNSNAGCSAKANAYAGTFEGGMGSPTRVKRYVRQLMWRLEALRAKGGGQTIGINSGFRSLDYNSCIGGAGSSQHLYGTAADQRMANVSNHRERRLAQTTDFSGIGCYSGLSHNHFDIRLNNRNLPSSQFWWWPTQNRQGQDLDDQNKPCYGEVASSTASSASIPRPELLSSTQIRAFATAGETGDLGTGD